MIHFGRFGWRFAGSTVPAVQDIDLHIRSGEFVVLTGCSGAGKSTLALAMCGLLIGRYPGRATGAVRVNGLDVAGTSLCRMAEHIGLVQQNPDRQFATLSVGDEVAFALENRCVEREQIRQATDEALTLLGIAPLRERRLSTLSGGEKQRVAIASLLAGRPAALVLDEPTASLDPEGSRDLFGCLASLVDQTGLTVVIIEHRLDQLLPLQPRVLWLEDGRLVGDEGRPAVAPRTSAALGSPPLEARAHNGPQRQAAQPRLVDMSNVTILEGRDKILDDVSLRIEPREVVALLGPNGGGKTTLLHALMGLVQPTAGAIRTCGHPVSARVVSRLSRHVGLVFQNADHQLVAETVREEALFAARHLGLPNKFMEQQADRLLEQAGLSQRLDDHPYRLSWGQKRRLNLISAVLHQPRLLLLDEPFAGQDWENVGLLLAIIRGVCRPQDGHSGLGCWGAREAGACILVTHDPRIVRDYCTRVVFLSAGRMLLDAPVAKAFERLREMGHDAYVPVGCWPASGGSALSPQFGGPRGGALLQTCE